MLSQRSPVVARVGFKDLDWEEEKGKSIKGLRRRQQKKDRRRVLRNKRIISNQQLKAFAQFAIADEDESAKHTRDMDACELLFQNAHAQGFVTFDSGQTVEAKAFQLLGMIDTLLKDKLLQSLLTTWMYLAAEKEYFSIPDDTDSLACSSFTIGSSGKKASPHNSMRSTLMPRK
jgi:GDP-D-mannose dehydratase